MKKDPSTLAVLRLAESLSPAERDNLKYRLSIVARNCIKENFELPDDQESRLKLYKTLDCLQAIQPYRKRVPSHGIAWRGRPTFLTDEFLWALRAEARTLRKSAKFNFNQFIARVETSNSSALCERLADSRELLEIVERYAGPCTPSHVTSYIYYDAAGQCSRPHVDNYFTSVTAMLVLEHACAKPLLSMSHSVTYWADREPFMYHLVPGEMAIFFGASTLHGRTPVVAGEKVCSLLVSYRST